MSRYKIEKFDLKVIDIGTVVELWPSDVLPNLICGRVVIKQFGEIYGEEGLDKYMVEVEYVDKRMKSMEKPFWLPLALLLEHLKPDWVFQELFKLGYDKEGFLTGKYDHLMREGS